MSDEMIREPTPIPLEMQRLQHLFNGYRISQMLYVAARLGIADLLAEGPKTLDELAAATGANADALYRVLRALASLDVFEEVADHRFALTPTAALLQQDHPYSARGQALFFGEDAYRAWGDLLHTVMTGETAFDHVFGAHHWEYLAQHPAASAVFNQSMTGNSQRAAIHIVAAFNLASVRTIVDVGGGHGLLLAAVLRANPALHGILFDEEHVVAGALPTLEASGVADRCERVAGNFFEPLPSGADVYMMRHILHDWDDEHCVAILRNCAQAAAPDGRVVVIESVIEPGNAPSPAKFLDLMMMVMNGGRERTADQFQALFAAAGLALTRITPTAAESLIEGVRE